MAISVSSGNIITLSSFNQMLIRKAKADFEQSKSKWHIKHKISTNINQIEELYNDKHDF